MSNPDMQCYLQFVVVNKGKSSKVTQIARQNNCPGNITIPARGTAHSDILDMLGLEKHEKEVIFTFVREEDAYRSLQSLRQELKLDQPGHGIAFQCPIGLKLGLKSIFNLYDKKEAELHQGQALVETSEMSEEALKEGIIEDGHRLLYIVVPQGHADDLVEKARESGAVGGTIIHGKGFGVHDASLLFGIHIDPEKEILLLLVRQSVCETIVRNLVEKGRLSEPGRGICLVLPVSRVTGLWHKLPQPDETGSLFE